MKRAPSTALLFALTLASVLALLFFCGALVDWLNAHGLSFGYRAKSLGMTSWYWPAGAALALTGLLLALGRALERLPKRRSVRTTSLEDPDHVLHLDAGVGGSATEPDRRPAATAAASPQTAQKISLSSNPSANS